MSRKQGPVQGSTVLLEPADEANVDLLIGWTLNPLAQGPYKRVPDLAPADLRKLFLDEPSRQYFLIRAYPEGVPLGRFYWRAWRFAGDQSLIDYEINILIADPRRRGQGLGSAVLALAVEHLLSLSSTRSVFAYTDVRNSPGRRALQKAGLREAGALPLSRYPVHAGQGNWVLYTAERCLRQT